VDKAALKRAAYTGGKLLGFIGIAYVGYKLMHDFSFESFKARLETSMHLWLPLLLINIVSTLVGIYGWHELIVSYAKKPVSFVVSFFYFARTEVAKYLPGNVFHFVGRQAYASALGLTQSAMAKVSLAFTLALVSSTLVASALLAAESQSAGAYRLALAGAAVAGIVAFYVIFPTITPKRKTVIVSSLTLSLAMQGCMPALLAVPQNADISLFTTVAAVYVLSWLVGFVTPGASGGMGVREGAFVAIAQTANVSIDMQAILFAVVFVRFFNILTDAVLYIATYRIKPDDYDTTLSTREART
jgi:hypothetical protein